MTKTPQVHRHWTQRWQQADLDARFEMVWNEYRLVLHKVANHALSTCDGGRYANLSMNYEWAQDAVQEGLLLAYIHLKRHPTEVIRFPASWLCEIIARAAVHSARRNYRAFLHYNVPLPWQEKDLPDDEAIHLFLTKYQEALPREQTETIEELLVAREQQRQARTAIDTVLNEEEQLVLRAKYDDGRPYEDIAVSLGRSVGALKSIAKRALAKAKAEYVRRDDEVLLHELSLRGK